MGRQTGKSTTLAAKAIWFAFTNPNSNVLVVSATLRQSMLFFDKVLSYVYGSNLVKDSLRWSTRTRLQFKNNSMIIALPCGRFGASLRGHTAKLIVLDEAAFIPEEVIANVVFPMISTTDGYAWLLSTPWDKEHIFYKCFTASDWSVYHLPSSKNPLIKPDFLAEQQRLIGEERFRMEYLAEFLDDAKSYFPMTLLRTCVDDLVLWEKEPLPKDVSGEFYAGYDPGGKESFATFAVVENQNGKLIVKYAHQETGKPYTTVNVEIAEYCKAIKAYKLCVDQTGLGNPIIEHLQELDLSVEGLSLTQKVKEELFSNLKILLEQQKLYLPNIPELLGSLNCIEYVRTRTGGYSFSHRQGSYDDLAFALALACWAAKEPGSGSFVKL